MLTIVVAGCDLHRVHALACRLVVKILGISDRIRHVAADSHFKCSLNAEGNWGEIFGNTEPRYCAINDVGLNFQSAPDIFKGAESRLTNIFVTFNRTLKRVWIVTDLNSFFETDFKKAVKKENV